MLTKHISTPHGFHILSRKDGKNGKYLQNIFQLHTQFIFEQEGWQKRQKFTQHNSTQHEFHILNRKDGKNGKVLHNIILLHMNFIF